MNVLITGGTGFIGSHLVDFLIKKDYNISVLIRKKSDKKYIKKHIERNIITPVYGDLTDLNSLKNATKNMDFVYHTAAVVKENGYTKEIIELFDRINVEGTQNLMQSCRINDVKKIVHFSSVAAIGPISKIADEKTRCNPNDPYGKSKLEGEKIAINFFKKNDLPVTVVRPSTVYGPRSTTSRLNLFKIIKNGEFRIIGEGTNKMPFVYVEDIVKGSFLAAESKISSGEVYILSNDDGYTMNEIAYNIADELRVDHPPHVNVHLASLYVFLMELLNKASKKNLEISREKIKVLANDYFYSISKAKKELGYTPSVDMKSGIAQTVEWYKKNNYL